GHAVAVDGGWSAAVDVALRHPEALVVTRAGDRFGASGWRIGSAGSGATRAALDEARQRAAAAADAVESAQGAVASADAELGLARADEHAAAKELDANDALLSAAGDALQRVETQRRDGADQIAELRGRRSDLATRVGRDAERRAELEALLPVLEDE